MIKKPAMGTFHKWCYPNSWMVYYNGNPDEMDDEMGCPHDEMNVGQNGRPKGTTDVSLV